ncbi:acyl-CoA dehydrogenase family protein [Pelagibacterium xiamenense]|uniref:acyl-CoA dehydrogenase family protein n=1 Tax=Pelagibacterium xiamenense TaxID=2901140 RepID=UPI001E2F216F|nr:acyl-CoA dehydrogenase family protein [Pelagibacterium xiamenense]MCD7059007.1 acyl-CoA/acyl-ACP dehydrogenase [Pelagibacterium xiamenense]
MQEPARETKISSTAAAFGAAGDAEGARDIGALDDAASAVSRKLSAQRAGLVERLIYGPPPEIEELQAGGRICATLEKQTDPVLAAAMGVLKKGVAFTADGKLSGELRDALARAGAYGLTIPRSYGGTEASYLRLASIEEALAANGLGPLAVELSGELTIGAGALLGYGSETQRSTFLPLVAEGALMGFALTEVGTGINAKKIRAYVETDADGNYRLFAEGASNKLWITNATHGGLVAIAARIGKTGKELGLFVTQLPQADVAIEEDGWEFRCEPSGVDAFTANYNSRLHFANYPIPAQNRIPGDGVEVLFYCLRLGRCMLAAMSAGYQRMLARDAVHYARERQGVGGLVIRHELPRLAIGRMLGGSLQARALAFLALSQDEARSDLAGLRDFTKSAASQTALDSMVACEHVLGGRAFDRNSRINAARPNLHLFGVVEGEDEMIRMGAVRDVTQRFVETYLAPLLGEVQAINTDADGNAVPEHRRLLRLGWRDFLKHPAPAFRLLLSIVTSRAAYRLLGWIARNGCGDLLRAAGRLIPAAVHPRYRSLPRELRPHARFAERELRRIRWHHLRLSVALQLELTTAQVALQRLGQRIEWLVSILAICHHAATQDSSQWHIASLQSLLLRERVRANSFELGGANLKALRQAIGKVGLDAQENRSSLLNTLEPQGYAHPFK